MPDVDDFGAIQCQNLSNDNQFTRTNYQFRYSLEQYCCCLPKSVKENYACRKNVFFKLHLFDTIRF